MISAERTARKAGGGEGRRHHIGVGGFGWRFCVRGRENRVSEEKPVAPGLEEGCKNGT